MEGSCRLCFSEGVKLRSVFEFTNGLEISDLVENICCIRIRLHDLFSKTICGVCFDTIAKAHDLRLLSMRNEQCLKEQFEVEVKIETITEMITFKSESTDNFDQDNFGDNAIDSPVLPALMKQPLEKLKQRKVRGEQQIINDKRTNTFHCDICSTSKQSKDQIEHHIMQEHVTENVCPICSKVLCSSVILRQHMQRQHSEKISLKCELCSEVLTSKKKFTMHQDVHKYFIEDEPKKFTCRFCHTSYKNQIIKMFRHINYHKRRVVRQTEKRIAREDSESLVCPHCGQIYRTKQILQQHIKRHFDIGSYACPKCPRKFKTWGELFYHNAVHTTERNFICEICSKGFKSKRDLRNHRIRHETKDVKTFQCPHCLIFLKSRYTLNRHILIHTGEKPFSCTYCERSFTQKNELNKHLRIHVGECTYRCEEPGCTEAFRLLAELRLHQEDHYTKTAEKK